MSCWHSHGHGCRWPSSPGWSDVVEPPWRWHEEYEPSERRGRRSPRRRGLEPEVTRASLEARVEDLQEELQRVRVALDDLAAETPETSD